jgi:hypothetical protein
MSAADPPPSGSATTSGANSSPVAVGGSVVIGSAQTHGPNSPAVVASADVTINIGAGEARIELDLRHKLAAGAHHERELLLTELRAIALVGRQEELAELLGWLGSPTPSSVRCLTGRAGSGKTRLGIELCEQGVVTKTESRERRTG